MLIIALDDEDRSWRKSSYSAGNGECVEVTASPGRGIFIRDSKDPAGPALSCSPDSFRSFLEESMSEVLSR